MVISQKMVSGRMIGEDEKRCKTTRVGTRGPYSEKIFKSAMKTDNETKGERREV